MPVLSCLYKKVCLCVPSDFRGRCSHDAVGWYQPSRPAEVFQLSPVRLRHFTRNGAAGTDSVRAVQRWTCSFHNKCKSIKEKRLEFVALEVSEYIKRLAAFGPSDKLEESIQGEAAARELRARLAIR